MGIIIVCCDKLKSKDLYNENKTNFEYYDNIKINEKLHNMQNFYNELNDIIKNKHLIIFDTNIILNRFLHQSKFQFILVLPTLNRVNEIYKTDNYLFCEEFCYDMIYKNNNDNDFPIYRINIGYLKDNMEAIIKEYRRFYNC